MGTQLTPRESQVVMLLSDGLRSKEIAHRLGISYETVRVYISRMTKNTGKNRIQLAILGARLKGCLAS